MLEGAGGLARLQGLGRFRVLSVEFWLTRVQHTFLQRLPNIPQLRSINIPHIADYVTPTFEPRELAHQIADIITLRPEIRLCYVGIGTKCFEILEARDPPPSSNASGTSSPGAAADYGANNQVNEVSTNVNGVLTGDQQVEGEEDTTSEEDDDEDGEEEDDSTDSDEDDDNTPTTATSDPDEAQSDNDAAEPEEDSDDDGFVDPDKGGIKLRLREILFYDDKVAIFRARHGKL